MGEQKKQRNKPTNQPTNKQRDLFLSSMVGVLRIPLREDGRRTMKGRTGEKRAIGKRDIRETVTFLDPGFHETTQEEFDGDIKDRPTSLKDIKKMGGSIIVGR